MFGAVGLKVQTYFTQNTVECTAVLFRQSTLNTHPVHRECYHVAYFWSNEKFVMQTYSLQKLERWSICRFFRRLLANGRGLANRAERTGTPHVNRWSHSRDSGHLWKVWALETMSWLLKYDLKSLKDLVTNKRNPKASEWPTGVYCESDNIWMRILGKGTLFLD